MHVHLPPAGFDVAEAADPAEDAFLEVVLGGGGSGGAVEIHILVGRDVAGEGWRRGDWVFAAESSCPADDGLASSAAVGGVNMHELDGAVGLCVRIARGSWEGTRAPDIGLETSHCSGHGGNGDGLVSCGFFEVGDLHAEGGIGV